MKCSSCNRPGLTPEDFAINRAKKRGRHNKCKACQKEYKDAHYKRNRRKYIQKTKLRRKEFEEFVRQVKIDVGKCKTCDEKDICCLQFHHLDSKTKRFNLSEAGNKAGSKQRIIEEIKKCVLLCANCHAKYHAGREKIIQLLARDVSSDTVCLSSRNEMGA